MKPRRVFQTMVVLISAWLGLGVYRDREWAELYLFLKHRPSIHFFFHAPCGESERALHELPPGLQRAERLYREFVEAGGGWRRSVYLPLPRFPRQK